MDSTTNYNLPLLTSSDNNTKVQDTFEAIMADDSDSAMSKIDAALKTNADVANAAIPKSIGTASDMVPVSSGVGAWTAKTLPQFKTWLSLASANISDFASAVSGNSDVSANTSNLNAHTNNKSNPHGTTAAQVGALPLTGGTLSGHLTGKYITGTLLQTTAITDLNAVATRFAVVDGSGWMYYRSAVEMLSDLGVNDAIQSAIGNAMAASY